MYTYQPTTKIIYFRIKRSDSDDLFYWTPYTQIPTQTSLPPACYSTEDAGRKKERRHVGIRYLQEK